MQFGRDNHGAHDDYIYAVSSDQWDNGSEMRLGRAHKSKVLDAEAWEYADTDGYGNVSWQTGLDASNPVLTIEGHMGTPEMVYISSIKKYLLLTWALHEDFRASSGGEFTIL